MDQKNYERRPSYICFPEDVEFSTKLQYFENKDAVFIL